MIAMILTVVGSYFSAKHIKSIWLAFPSAIILALISNVVTKMVLPLFLTDISSEAVIYGIVAGLVWYPIIAIIAFVVFRVRTKDTVSDADVLREKSKSQSGEKKKSST